LDSISLNFEEFQTALIEIEAVVNSRPLCAESTDPNDFRSLTPGHFLIGRPFQEIPQLDVAHLKMNQLGRWQLVQRAKSEFAKRWREEYLHHLQTKGK